MTLRDATEGAVSLPNGTSAEARPVTNGRDPDTASDRGRSRRDALREERAREAEPLWRAYWRNPSDDARNDW